MTLPRTPRSGGGNKHPVNWGPWCRDTLADGHSTWGHQLFGEYVAYVKTFPTKKGRRHVVAYRSFLNYLYILRQLGLIDYDIDPATGQVQTSTAHDKGGNLAPDIAERRYFHAVLNKIGDSAWNDPWYAYLGYKPGRP